HEDSVHAGVFHHGTQLPGRIIATRLLAIQFAQRCHIVFHILRTKDQRAGQFGPKDQKIGNVMGLVAVVINMPVAAMGRGRP
ncbi:MAG: hypothetical protein MO852_04215, partial [Candidatus Devosia euplotis]|nr:hypothetical protein [Candidatus Devosia euplotis]